MIPFARFGVRVCLVLAMLAVTAMTAVPARAQAPVAVPGGAAEQACAALAGADFSAIPDAPTQVTATRVVPAAANGVPAHCEIQAYVAPNVGMALYLPVTGWNGKFSQIGCGGFCGILFPGACAGMLSRGYACIHTDMGHKSTALDAKWAFNNLQAEVDFAFRATHVTTLAGKAITNAYYGRDPSKSYFLGCSTGGRQGMVEAQRFPWDYDGIVVGAPPIDETGDGMALLWNVVATLDRDGRTLLGPDDVQFVHERAIAACDRLDGVADGVIEDPRACRFDPQQLVCKAGETARCLTPAQATAVAKIYAGPHDSKGRPTYTGGAMPGSELNWIGNYVARGSGPSVYAQFMRNMFAFMNFSPDPGPAWKLSDFDWDRDHRRLGLMEALYTGANPDLRRFRAAGGKMLVYQGWADQSVLPLNILDYWETMQRTMGGPQATAEFARLFMVPGMNHCRGGGGAYSIDYLSHLEAWVEQGRAPDALDAVHPKRNDMPWQYGARQVAEEDVGFRRSITPYGLAPPRARR
jgi:hypothetical protein